MAKSLVYNTIAIVETGFQNFQIECMVSHDLISPEVLLLDLRLGAYHPNKKGFVIEGEFYPFNLNNPKDFLESISSIIRFRLRYTIKCTTLVSTYFHGFSSRFLSNYIGANKRLLIDDGIGSYIFYSNYKTKLNSTNYIVKLNFVHLLSVLLTGKLSLIGWKNIDFYCTGYNLQRNERIKAELIVYQLWQNSFYARPEVAFIGSPEVEFSGMPISMFYKIIDYVYSRHGTFEYYAHRNEDISKLNNENRVNVRYINSSVEEFFMAEKCPKHVYGLNSSSLLHLGLANRISVSAFTGYRFDAYDKEIRKVLKACNVSLIDVKKI